MSVSAPNGIRTEAGGSTGHPSRWVAGGFVALTVLGVVAMISPGLIFTPTLPVGGDMGAHVYPLREFVYRLLPSGAVLGWTDGWYAGMPLFYFYFPLPALITAAFAPVVGFEVALKLMMVLGPLTLPPAAYAVLRATGMSRWQATGGSIVGSTFLLMASYSILGGNLLSANIGEFAYSISFTFSLLYLAVVLKAGRSGTAAPLAAAALLGLTALSHVLTTAFIVLVTLPLALDIRYSRTILGSWGLGFLFAGFWAFPFLARFQFSSGSVWVHGRSLTELFPVEILPFLPFALVGAWKAHREFRGSVLPLLLIPVAACVVYAIPQGFFHSARLLPYAFFVIHAFAGVAIGAALQAAIADRSRVAIGVATAGIWVVVALNFARDPRLVHEKIAVTMAGYEAAEMWSAYKPIVDSVSALPPGRLFWEESAGTIEHGTGMAMSILPYWSPEHPVLGGLWIESSTTHPFLGRLIREVGEPAESAGERGDRVVEFSRGIAHARVMGGRYFLAFSASARALAEQHPAVTSVADHDDWGVYRIADVSLVTAAVRTPVVYSGSGFKDVAVRWFETVPDFEPWIVADGAPTWPRVDAELTDLSVSDSLRPRTVTISDVRVGPETISFTTDAIGVPHLVRASFFPNWVSIGATGPYRAAPSFMVVVPTTERVELVFADTWVEWTGRGLTLVGLILAVVIAGRSGRSGPARKAGRRIHLPSYGRRR